MSSSPWINTSIPWPNSVNGTSLDNSVAVYFGQADTSYSLDSLCNDASVDIVIVAFVTNLVSPGGWPTLNVAGHCGPATQAQLEAEASSLVDCTSLSTSISTCQENGKKVLLSLGGATGNLSILSSQVSTVAKTIFDLFLDLSNETLSPIRPFGNVALDGLDINNEDHDQGILELFVSEMKKLFAIGSRKLYLSAAPQCLFPDASIPLTSMQKNMDFISVQFYNNPSCNLGSNGFLDAVRQWSSHIGNLTSVFIGAPTFTAAAAAGGFVTVDEYRILLSEAVKVGPNIKGAMFWDGAHDKTGQYRQVAKSLLR